MRKAERFIVLSWDSPIIPLVSGIEERAP